MCIYFFIVNSLISCRIHHSAFYFFSRQMPILHKVPDLMDCIFITSEGYLCLCQSFYQQLSMSCWCRHGASVYVFVSAKWRFKHLPQMANSWHGQPNKIICCAYKTDRLWFGISLFIQSKKGFFSPLSVVCPWERSLR